MNTIQNKRVRFFFVNAFSYILNKKLVAYNKKGSTGRDARYFRWHDSGDLQSVNHLALIIEIAKKTPSIRHWLPTREYKIIVDGLKEMGYTIDPATKTVVEVPNLTIRLSAHMVGKMAPEYGFPVSGVHEHGSLPEGYESCTAYRTDKNGVVVSHEEYMETYNMPHKQGVKERSQWGYCGDCRKCWDCPLIAISYPKH